MNIFPSGMTLASAKPPGVTINIFIIYTLILSGALPLAAGGLLDEIRAASAFKAKSVLKAESISVSPGPPGYPVINVTTAGCQGDGVYLLNVTSCDRQETQRTRKSCKELESGTMVCLLARFLKKTCFMVDGGGVSSNQVTLQPFVMRVNNTLYESPWSRQRDSNVSVVTVTKSKAAALYTLKLRPQAHQPLPHQVAGDTTVPSCSSQDDVTLEGEVIDSDVAFSVNWNQLDKNCDYRPKVIPKNHCKDSLHFGIRLSLLKYTTFPATEVPPGDGGDSWLQTIVLCSLVLIGAGSLLAIVKIAKHHAVAMMMVEKDKHNEGMPTKDEVQSLAQRRVLVVYAWDVEEKAKGLITRLQKESKHQILDLYDQTDIDKLDDPSIWLTKRFSDPNTVFIVVGSRVAKRTQGLQLSTVYSDYNIYGQKMDEQQELKTNGQEKNGKGRREEEQCQVGEEGGKVFHFLLTNALHTMKDSYLTQDYKRFYSVKFTDDPSQAELDYVTPNCCYHLPDNYRYLINAINWT